jgi:hypothetical protein
MCFYLKRNGYIFSKIIFGKKNDLFGIFIIKEFNMAKIVRLTERDLTRLVRKVIKEQTESDLNQVGSKNLWSQIEKGLITFNNPKVIRSKTIDEGKPFTSLNWGSHKEKGHNWGVSVSSDDNDLAFQTSDEINGKIFKDIAGITPDYNKLSKNWSSHNYKLDYSNPTKVISFVKNLISSLE